jgi:hypothetical protein
MANAMVQAPDGSANDFVSEDMRRAAELDRTERARQKQSLNLQRENILSQKTSHPARRAALAAALEQVEAQISALE